MRSKTALMVFIVSWGMYGSSQEPVQPTREDILHGIHRGDTVAMNAAGRSGDPSFIPSLLEQLRVPKDEYAARAAQLAAAKLGDSQQLQAVFCEVQDVAGIDPQTQQKLEYIGGGFSILTLETLFDRDSESGAIVKRKKLWKPGDDFVLGKPSSVALALLASLVPNARIGEPTYNAEEDRKKIATWRDWISNHQSDIQSMPPGGTAVIFSKAGCGKVKAGRPSSR